LDHYGESPYPDRVTLINLTSAAAVLQAADEFDRIGREAFLAKYGFGPAQSYFVEIAGRRYDSKAIAGAAHGYQHPELGPLRASDFSGGEATVQAKLEELGFEVVVENAPKELVLQLVVKWSSRSRPDAVERHIEIAEEKGAVWWGLLTSASEGWKMSEQWFTQLRGQISRGLATYAFISGPTCWRAALLGVEYERGSTDQALIPGYYAPDDRHHLWVKLASSNPLLRTNLSGRSIPSGDQASS
jgi:hypothetical protein